MFVPGDMLRFPWCVETEAMPFDHLHVVVT